MRSFRQLVFDENVGGTGAVYTTPDWDALLGLTDSLTISGYASAVSGTNPTITVQVEQGPDRRHWANRNGTAEVSAVALSTSADTAFSGNDGTPLGATRPGFARLRIQLGGSGSPKGRVKIWVTGRDLQRAP